MSTRPLPPINAPIRFYGDQGVVQAHNPATGEVLLCFDRNARGEINKEWTSDIDCIDLLEYGAIEDFAHVAPAGHEIRRSPYGYLIDQDGATYSLLGRGYHGVILAMLYPDEALALGYRQPDRRPNAGHYTNFMMQCDDLPTVRISFGYITAVAISKGAAPATPDQIKATQQAMLSSNVKLNDPVSISHKDTTLRRALDWLKSEGSDLDEQSRPQF